MEAGSVKKMEIGWLKEGKVGQANKKALRGCKAFRDEL
jgi:hypothetical protein